MDKKRTKDKLTILIDSEIKRKFKEHCDLKGLILGKQIELLLESELKNIENKEGENVKK